MSIPVSPLVVALNLFVPGVFWLGLLVARRLFAQRLQVWVVGAALGLGGWLVLTHALSLAAGSFVVGLTLSTSSAGVLGYILARRKPHVALSWGALPSSLAWGVMLLLVVPVVVMALRWDFHDETSQNGHIAITASIFNAYPPRNLSFPQFPLQYHYGFDLLCAMLVALCRLSLVRAIDVATILLWCQSLLLLWLLGERIVGRGYGVLVIALVSLGAGMPFVCEQSISSPSPLGAHLSADCGRSGLVMNPPLISYFFQHPWSLGLPLALAALLVQAQDRGPPRALRLATLACLLGALCLTQTALFCSIAGVVALSELVDERREAWRWRIASAAILLGACGLSVALFGGFWSQPSALTDKLVQHLGVAEGARESLRWLWGTFGVLLLGLLGVFWLERRRLLFLALALGGLLVINVVRYVDTWDIVKFATVAGLGLAVLLAGLVKRLHSSRFSLLSLGVPAVLTVGATICSAMFIWAIATEQPGASAHYRYLAPDFPADDRAAAELLRKRMPPDAVMYRQYAAFRPYALFAGLPQVWVETPFPINMRLMPRRKLLSDFWPSDESAYLKEGVRFFVLDGTDGRLTDVVERWLVNGSATQLGRFGALRVIEPLRRDSPAAAAEARRPARGDARRALRSGP